MSLQSSASLTRLLNSETRLLSKLVRFPLEDAFLVLQGMDFAQENRRGERLLFLTRP